MISRSVLVGLCRCFDIIFFKLETAVFGIRSLMKGCHFFSHGMASISFNMLLIISAELKSNVGVFDSRDS